jgi:hypothetical protein
LPDTIFQGSKTYSADMTFFSWLRTDSGNACTWVMDYLENMFKTKLSRPDGMTILYWYGRHVSQGNIPKFAGPDDAQAKNDADAVALASGFDSGLCYNVLYALYAGAQLDKSGCKSTLDGKSVSLAEIATYEGPGSALGNAAGGVLKEVVKAGESAADALGLGNLFGDFLFAIVVIALVAGAVYYFSHKRG